jgi:diacylglycerol kinase family enzyme
LDDGWFDVIRVGPMSQWEVLCALPRLAARGVANDHHQIQLSRCRAITVQSRQPLAVHSDGELLFRAEDGVHEMEIETLPARLTVQLGL